MGSGREGQKRRTRAALVKAAQELTGAGRTPSVAEVADAAGVSRRTAYRYFRTQEQLLAETALERFRPRIELAIARARSVEDALDRLVNEIQRLAVENEELLRAMLRLSLDRRLEIQPGGIMQGARRVEWIESAVSPLRKQLPKREFDRLTSALAVCIGIEAVTVLREVCGLTGRKSIEITRWTAKALLHAAVRR